MLKASLRGCLLIFDPPYNRSRNCVDTITTSMPFDATRCPPDESNEELALLMLPSVICLTMRTSGLDLDITRCHQTNRKPVLEHLMMRPIVRRTTCTPRLELHMLPSGVCRMVSAGLFERRGWNLLQFLQSFALGLNISDVVHFCTRFDYMKANRAIVVRFCTIFSQMITVKPKYGAFLHYVHVCVL